MATEIYHSNISDAYLHEAKGSAGASVGQLLTANGDGTSTFQDFNGYGEGAATDGQVLAADGAGGASFEDPNTLVEFAISDSVSSFSTVDQLVASAGDTTTIVFGTSDVTSPNGSVTIDSAGLVTFNEDGVYEVQAIGNTGRTTGTGVSTIAFRQVYNGSPIGNPEVISMDNADPSSASPIFNVDIVEATAGDNFSFELGLEVDDGGSSGLVATTLTSLTGWGTVPSARIAVRKLEVV